MQRSSGLVWIAVATLGFATAASASPSGTGSVQVNSVTISYDAADAATSQGARELFDRIRQAADKVCRIASYPVGYEIWHQHACEAKAVSEAVRQANIQALVEQRKGRGSSSLTAAR
jgi:UrcA family protein